MARTTVLVRPVGSEMLGDIGGQRHEVVALGECGAVKAAQGFELVIVSAVRSAGSSVTSWGNA